MPTSVALARGYRREAEARGAAARCRLRHPTHGTKKRAYHVIHINTRVRDGRTTDHDERRGGGAAIPRGRSWVADRPAH